MPEHAAPGPRPLWSGTISFGLVSVPVDILPATRSQQMSLRMVSPEGKPLSRRYFTRSDDRELASDEIVRGYEVEKDRFVVVEDDELERLAPERSRDIDLRLFVQAAELDPIHFDRPYYLVPSGESTKAYRLLARVMEETDRAGIASFVMRGKEYLVAILAERGILEAVTLRFADEIRSPETMGLPDPVEPEAAEVKRMEKAIRDLTGKKLDMDEMVEESTERLRALVEKKARGRKGVKARPATGQADRSVIDLMERLQRSLRPESRPAPGAGGSAPDDLERRSKKELYERAKQLDVPGRSSMDKDELIEAIRRGSEA